MRTASPSLQRAPGPVAKRQKPGTIEGLFGKASLRAPVVSERGIRSEREVTGRRVVDLFCGLGGFSQGATRAGHTVVLGVDNWQEGLKAHRRNHPHAAHACLKLGPETEAELEALIHRAVPKGSEWHLHGSPPCQKLSKMKAVRPDKEGKRVDEDTKEAGLRLVCWYFQLVIRLKPTTWSFEQVVVGELRGLLQFASILYPTDFDYAVVRMERYGVPQSRKRFIAGSPALIHRLDTDESLREPAPIITEILKPPPNAVYMRSSVGRSPHAGSVFRESRCGDVRPIASLCWTCTASKAHAWLDAGKYHISEFTIDDIRKLQTFDARTKLPPRRSDALRAIGNAIPPLFVAKLMGWQG